MIVLCMYKLERLVMWWSWTRWPSHHHNTEQSTAGDSPDVLVKGIGLDCKWFPIILTATGHILVCARAHIHTQTKTGTMNRNLDVLVRVAPKADRLQGWQVRFTPTPTSDGAALGSKMISAKLSAQNSDVMLMFFAVVDLKWWRPIKI